MVVGLDAVLGQVVDSLFRDADALRQRRSHRRGRRSRGGGRRSDLRAQRTDLRQQFAILLFQNVEAVKDLFQVRRLARLRGHYARNQRQKEEAQLKVHGSIP